MIYKPERLLEYNRKKAVAYAHTWAYGRNPAYYDFEKLGGDCTNFASQVVYAGSGIMNYTPVYGWYYINSYNRTPSWTGAMYFYKFLISNKGQGPFGEETDMTGIMPGDIIQLSFKGDGIYSHTPVVVSVGKPPKLDNILVAAHSYDRDNYPITNYSWADIRFIHIKGVRR
jgi:hypothetical protein